MTDSRNNISLPLRTLSTNEIRQLQTQGCRASDWDSILITDETDISVIWNTFFSGKISIGKLSDSENKLTGFYNASIDNCVIGDNTYIRNIGCKISNCIIGNNTIIENTAEITFDNAACCGVATSVSVLDETGSRSVTIYPGISAQIAALAALKPYWAKEHLSSLIERHIGENFPPDSRIGNNVTIRNCGSIRNVRISDDVTIDGAARLCNGSITNNSQDKPIVFIGTGVDAENFIIDDGIITGGALIRNVYVGQGAVLDKGFTAHDSLFFANCACENGEACALFAGPYTVSMHKSTLLIGAMTSFMNAGSATNQSNHMYKLGPVHWGIMERGVKTASGAYIMWNGRIGEFSLLMGQHKKHPDSSDFPFSYLFGDEKGETTIIPGMMLKSCGLIRDEKKWPERDNRLKQKLKPTDRINFEVLNPVTAGKMYKALELADKLLSNPADNDNFVNFKGMRISQVNLQRAKHLYSLAISKYVYVKKIEKPHPAAEFIPSQDWIDLCGQIMPRVFLEKACCATSVSEIEKIFDDAFAKYDSLENSWIDTYLSSFTTRSADELRRYAAEFDKMIEMDHRNYTDIIDRENSLITL